MSITAFNLFLGVMSLIALIVFIALYFGKAGYGIFRTASWGVAISNKLAWILMDHFRREKYPFQKVLC